MGTKRSIRLPPGLEHLGQPVGVFRKNGARFAPAILILFVLALGTFIIWIGVQPKEGPLGDRLLIAAIGAAITLLAIVVLWWRLRRCELVPCEHGLAKVVGRSVDACRWEDVQRVYRKCQRETTRADSPSGGDHIYRLQCAGDRTIRFTSTFFLELDRMDDVLHEHVYPRLLDEAVGALNRGESVDFDVFRVSIEGISTHDDRHSVAWADIHPILGDRQDVRGAEILELVAQQDRAFRGISADQIPNVPVLLALLESIRRSVAP